MESPALTSMSAEALLQELRRQENRAATLRIGASLLQELPRLVEAIHSELEGVAIQAERLTNEILRRLQEHERCCATGS